MEAGKAGLLATRGSYLVSESTTPASWEYGQRIDFVQSTQGWFNYGTVITTQSYTGGGGTLQMYVPYGSGYGGTQLKYRMGDYSGGSNGNSWTGWKTILDNTSATVDKLQFTGVGSNSNVGAQSYAIYQQSGAWSNPFPDLVISYHTGIKIGAHKNYNGTRFYNDSPESGSQIFSVGDGDDHVRVSNNLYVGGNLALHQGNHVGGTNYMNKTGSYWNANNWIQLSSNHGLYWPNNYSYHLYLDSQYLQIRNNNNANGIQVRTNNTTLRGYLYADNSNQIGLLNNTGGWSLKMDSSGNLTATGNVTAYSDIRIKKNVRTVDDALEKVKSMRGVYFDRKDTGKASVGVIAQEIEEVLPQVVETTDTRTEENPDALEDLKTVSYGNIVGVLIEAIKEQQEQINTLKEEIKSIKHKT